MIAKLIKIIIVALILTSLTSITFGTIEGIVPLDDGRIAVWSQLDSAQIILQNGQNIAYLSSRNDIQIPDEESYQETIKRPLDICFILDCSGSMSGNKIATLKSSTIRLIESLKRGSEEKNVEVRIAIIPYASKVEDELSFVSVTSSMETITSKIEGLIADGNTATCAAIKSATFFWKDQEKTPDIDKYTVLVTDGQPTDGEPKDILKNFKKNHNDVNFMTLIVGSNLNTRSKKSLIDKFKCDGCTVSFTDDDELSTAIESGIKSWMVQPSFEFSTATNVVEKHNFFEAGNTYNAIVDEELLYGATLVVNYSVHVKSIDELSKLQIKNYLPPGMSLDWSYPEPNNTNYDEGTLVFNINAAPAQREFEIKIKASKILTSANDVQNIDNTADILIQKADGTIVNSVNEIQKRLAEEGTQINSEKDLEIGSYELSIIPPFGRCNNCFRNIILDNWQLVLAISFSALFIVYYLWRKEINKNKKE